MMQFQMMCHGHTQTGKKTLARCHISRYLGTCYQPTCTISFSAGFLWWIWKCIWCLCLSAFSQRWHRPLNPQYLWVQGCSKQTLSSPSSSALSTASILIAPPWMLFWHYSSQEGTIKIEALTEKLSVVPTIKGRTLLVQSWSCSMAHICL